MERKHKLKEWCHRRHEPDPGSLSTCPLGPGLMTGLRKMRRESSVCSSGSSSPLSSRCSHPTEGKLSSDTSYNSTELWPWVLLLYPNQPAQGVQDTRVMCIQTRTRDMNLINCTSKRVRTRATSHGGNREMQDIAEEKPFLLLLRQN